MRSILVLGPGCSKCKVLAAHAEQAVQELGIEYEIQKITDLKQIMALGVMMTPGLVIDGTVKSVGRVVPVEEIKSMLK
ncbi:MAG: thioredoxin family protein [Calditrichaeota bacterium]|nr:thioredoxin family protein [Calditrichota bacterium]